MTTTPHSYSAGKGAVVGIVAGAVVAIAMTVLACWLCKRRKKRKRRAENEAADGTGTADGMRLRLNTLGQQYKIVSIPNVDGDFDRKMSIFRVDNNRKFSVDSDMVRKWRMPYSWAS